MQRFVSKRSSSSVDLASSSPDVRTERAATLSVGLHWPPVKRQRSAGRPSWQHHRERALQEHILHHRELAHSIRLRWPGWWPAGETITRLLTHEGIAHTSTPCAALPATPAAALVEDEASGSTAERRKTHADPVPREFNGINRNTPYRWKRSAPPAAPLGRKSLQSPADMNGLRECECDRRPLLQLGHDQEPAAPMARRRGTRRPSQPNLDPVVLHGMHLSHKKPSKCVLELRSPDQQHANTHRLFIKLCTKNNDEQMTKKSK